MSVRSRLVGVVVAAATVLGIGPGLVGPAVAAEDHDAPVLTALAVSPGPLHPGDPYTVSWRVEEQNHLARLLLRFDNDAPDAYGHFILVTSTQQAELDTGSITRTLPATAYSGTYRLTVVTATDDLGNAARYLPGGAVQLFGGAVSPTSHALDFDPVSTVALNPDRDVEPPVLQSVRASPESYGFNASPSVNYAATDTSKLYEIDLTYTSPSDATSTALNYTSGLAGVVYLQDPYLLGRHRLDQVRLIDNFGNARTYRRDGTWQDAPSGRTGTHSVDLGAGDFTVDSQVAVEELSPAPRSAVLRVRVPPEEGDETRSIAVSVSPGGQTLTLTGEPGRQVYEARIKGLTNGVRYTVRVTPTSARGTGSARTAATTPGLSTNVWGAGDVNLDGRADVFARLPDGVVRLYRGAGAFALRSGVWVFDGRPGARMFPGAQVGDHTRFHIVRPAPPAPLTTVDVHPLGFWGQETQVGTGWDVRFLDGSVDLTGDKVPDLVAVRWSGDTYLYRGRFNGGYASGVRIAQGWSSMQAVVVARDVTGNGTADLLAVDAAGVLWVYPGTGRGTFNPRVRVGAGWGGLGALFSGNDLTGDGKGDLGAITMDGTFRVYPGRGSARFGSGVAVSNGWAPYL